MPYCVMVKQAALQGKGIKSRLEHHKCDGATTALALEPSTEKIESGQEYFSYKLYSSVATARRLRSSIKSLHRMPVHNYGVAIVPLSQCVQTPDVIISICNAYQAMRYRVMNTIPERNRQLIWEQCRECVRKLRYLHILPVN